MEKTLYGQFRFVERIPLSSQKGLQGQRSTPGTSVPAVHLAQAGGEKISYSAKLHAAAAAGARAGNWPLRLLGFLPWLFMEQVRHLLPAFCHAADGRSAVTEGYKVSTPPHLRFLLSPVPSCGLYDRHSAFFQSTELPTLPCADIDNAWLHLPLSALSGGGRVCHSK